MAAVPTGLFLDPADANRRDAGRDALDQSDGLVVMEIKQQIESVIGEQVIDNVGKVPITSSKQAATKVSVRDHDTIIMGGLIETDKKDTRSGFRF